MATNSGQNSSPKPLVTSGKAIFIVLGVLLGVFVILGICFYINLDLTLVIMMTGIAIFALSVSVGLIVYKKRVSIYSIMALIIGFLFFTSGAIFAYGNTLSLHAEVVLNQVGIGLANTGIGLAFITSAAGSSAINKSAFMSYKYPKYSILTFLICGILLVAVGMFSLASGIRSWNMFIR